LNVRYALACRCGNKKNLGSQIESRQVEAYRTLRTFRAPGRVNLIGEHTDYNDGFVMPVAINFSTQVTHIPLTENRFEVFSKSFNEEVSFDLESPPTSARGHWSDYPIGVAVMLLRAGYPLKGARLSIQSDVPIGSGLSSSAAIEVATAFALTQSSGVDVDRAELATLCRKAENEFVGARVGIMDQFISFFGRRDKALLLDCRSLEFKLLPLSTEAQLVICNTMVKHALASGAYNERRAQCEEGVARLRSVLPGIRALRDVTSSALELHKDLLSEIVYRRCRHIVTENKRVLEAGEALERNDLQQFGKLMNESHESLRDDFEVSCKELDLMVGFAREVEGVFGARMTGGGFGGCTVNLVERKSVADFKESVANRYEETTGLKPEIYVCTAVNGAEEVHEDY
jgi:galactokinase